MNTLNALLSFSNILEVASLCAPAGSDYEMQERLVAECRANEKPFLSQMPVRHQFRCPVCKSVQGEVKMHFEDPRQPLEAQANSLFCPDPVGRFFDIEKSALHGILAHGTPMPRELNELLANVRG